LQIKGHLGPGFSSDVWEVYRAVHANPSNGCFRLTWEL